MLLINTQLEFIELLLADEHKTAMLIPAHHLSIYRNNVTTTLVHALMEIYPMVGRLLGQDFFSQTAKKYIEQYPSVSSNLAEYGAYLSDFLTTYSPVAHLAYLSEVAYFEWLCHTIACKADPPPMHSVTLLNTRNWQPGSPLQLVLHPASVLHRFHYPILRIIELCEGTHDECVDANQGGIDLLIIRREEKIKLITLSQEDFVFLHAIQAGEDLNTALTQAMTIHSQFNLIDKLPTWIQNQTIVAIYEKEM